MIGIETMFVRLPEVSTWRTSDQFPIPNRGMNFGDGLFELRPKGRSGIGRAFYCYMVGKQVIVLHAFIKKTQRTPENELKLARKRLKEVQHG